MWRPHLVEFEVILPVDEQRGAVFALKSRLNGLYDSFRCDSELPVEILVRC